MKALAQSSVLPEDEFCVVKSSKINERWYWIDLWNSCIVCIGYTDEKQNNEKFIYLDASLWNSVARNFIVGREESRGN